MFGLSFGELVVIVIVAIIAIGPKDMPKVLRKMGQYAGKLRRMASDLRAQSGIDDALRIEGISEDIQEIRKLARGELDSVQRAAAPNDVVYQEELRRMEDSLLREREYPRDGADGYDAIPDAAYIEHPLAMSVWARTPLYALGDPDGVLPPLPEGHDEPSPLPKGPELAEEVVPEEPFVAPVAFSPSAVDEARTPETAAPDDGAAEPTPSDAAPNAEANDTHAGTNP